MNEVAIVVSGLAIILTSITAIFSILAYAKVVGMEKSTHRLQYVPLDEESAGPTGEELVNQFKKMYNTENDYV